MIVKVDKILLDSPLAGGMIDALPYLLEYPRANGRVFYRVVGVMWGGDRLTVDTGCNTGTGTYEPSRYTAMMNSVKRIFARRSGTRNALRNAFSTVT